MVTHAVLLSNTNAAVGGPTALHLSVGISLIDSSIV